MLPRGSKLALVWAWYIRHISYQPNFLVLICLHTTIAMLVVRRFISLTSHMIEVIVLEVGSTCISRFMCD